MYPVNPELMDYLEKIIDLPISDFIMMIYCVFQIICPFMIKKARHTLAQCLLPEFEHAEIEANLK